MTGNRIDMADCSNRAAELDPVSDTARNDAGGALRSKPEHADAYGEVVMGHEAQWKHGLHSKTAHHANVGFAPTAVIPAVRILTRGNR